MILDTGYRCPEMQTFGFFPFAISEDYNELINASGWNGPVARLDATRTGFSGILGDGTFYPSAAHLDALSRLFWCVKDYTLNILVSKISFADMTTCEAPLVSPEIAFLYPPIQAFSYCGIGIYGGNPNELGPGDTQLKTLTLQDYCSYTAGTGTSNVNKVGFCPTETYGALTPNTNICVPVNPIQKFNDLLCRKSYFTWAPKQEEWQNFNTGNYQAIDSPYKMKFLQFRETAPLLGPPYDCGIVPIYFQDVHGMFTLSIMDTDAVAYSGNSVKYVSSNYTPDLSDWVSPFDCLGKSGEALTNSWGEITGYGINPKPSGMFSPPIYNIGSGFASYPSTGFNAKGYHPFIHFQLRLRNNPVATPSSCPMNDTISTLQQRSGQRPIGYFEILDFVSGNSLNADENTSILRAPLYATSSSNPNELFVKVQMRPGQRWVNTQHIPVY